MWWLLAIFSGVFMACGFSRPRYTQNNYVENYVDVDCDNGGGDCSYDSGDSYCDTSSSDDN